MGGWSKRSGYFDYPIGDAPAAPPEPRFLADATVGDWTMLVAHCERRACAPGDEVVRVGDDGRSLIIVRSGSFRVIRPDRRNRARDVGSIPAGSVFGEVGFLDGRPRSSTVIAAEPSEILVLDRAAFDRLARTQPRLALKVVEDLGAILAGRFRATGAGDD